MHAPHPHSRAQRLLLLWLAACALQLAAACTGDSATVTPGVDDGSSNYGRIRIFKPDHETERSCHDVSMQHTLDVARMIEKGDYFDVDAVCQNLEMIVDAHDGSSIAERARHYLRLFQD